MLPTPSDWLPSVTSTVLDAALAYARGGIRTIPVHGIRDGRCTCGGSDCKKGKHPVGNAWQRRATVVEDELRDLFRKAPKPCNVGLAMGPQPDGRYLIAIDVDGDRGRAQLAEYEAAHGPLPETLTSRSGRADVGEHRIFALSSTQDTKRLNNRAKLGLDVRVKGGQIVACPSLHESGNRYSWANAAPIATLPDAWFEAIAAPIPPPRLSRPPMPRNVLSFGDAYVRSVIENAAKEIAAGGEGERNHRLFAKACTVLEYCAGSGVSWEMALDRLRDAGRACGLPGREVDLTLRKAARQVETTGAVRRVPPPREREPVTEVRSTVPDAPVEPADDEDVGPLTEAWRAQLTVSKGKYEDCLANVITILGSHPAWKGVLQYDLFRETIVFTKPPPCRSGDVPSQRTQGSTWLETDDTRTQAWIREYIGFEPSRTTVADAVATVAERSAVHPVREYLSALTWDGEERLPTFLANYFGASPGLYTAGIGIKWMTSGVARVMKPGAQVDYMLVLEGAQGLGKSSGVRALVPRGEWFSDTGIVIGQKDSYLTLHGVWVYGFDELDSLRGNEITKTKNFLTSPSDRLRPPYGRRMREYQRQTIFVGTTNESEYLRDRTGNRRFWPVACSKINVEAIHRDRDQLWAEARARFERGERWWPDASLSALCGEEQLERTMQDPWLYPIGEWIETERARSIVSTHGGLLTHDVLVTGLSFKASDITRLDEMRAADVLRELGWSRGKQRRESGSKVRRFVREVVTGGDGGGDAQ